MGHPSRFEKLKRVILVADEFSAEDGTLTASMKLRRKVVAERYQSRIDEMYEQAEESGPGTPPEWGIPRLENRETSGTRHPSG